MRLSEQIAIAAIVVASIAIGLFAYQALTRDEPETPAPVVEQRQLTPCEYAQQGVVEAYEAGNVELVGLALWDREAICGY